MVLGAAEEGFSELASALTARDLLYPRLSTYISGRLIA